jgi:peptidyl-prolyl cis-trans isomerase C
MHYLRTLAVVSLLALAACQPKSGDGSVAGTTAGSSPVATVNGTTISHDLFDYYVRQVAGKPVSELTPEQRNLALDNLIRGVLVAQQASKDGLDRKTDNASLIELSRLNILQQAESVAYLKDKQPTERELRTEYETQVAQLPKLEYHAKHIVVATEPYAQRVIDRLEKGAKFEDVAKAESSDPSKDNGGDIGWFTPDRMDKPFMDAVLTLKPGEYTRKPVQTQYGWHVIELVETRDLNAPPFADVRQRLEQIVQTKKFRAYSDELMRGAKIQKSLDDKSPAADKKPEDKKG